VTPLSLFFQGWLTIGVISRLFPSSSFLVAYLCRPKGKPQAKVLGMGSVLYVLPRRFYGLMECHIDGQYSPGLSYRE